MDVQEWELLTKEGLFETDDEENKNPLNTIPTSLMSCFIRPQTLKTRVHPQIPQRSTQNLHQHTESAAADLPDQSEGIESGSRDDEDHCAEDFFSKMKETEFVGFQFDEAKQLCGKSKGDQEIATNREVDGFNILKWGLIGAATTAGFCIIGSLISSTNKNQKQRV